MPGTPNRFRFGDCLLEAEADVELLSVVKGNDNLVAHTAEILPRLCRQVKDVIVIIGVVAECVPQIAVRIGNNLGKPVFCALLPVKDLQSGEAVGNGVAVEVRDFELDGNRRATFEESVSVRGQGWQEAQPVISTGVGLSQGETCLLYTSPSPRDRTRSRMPSSA